MAIQTTPGKLLIDEALPEDMRGRNKELTSKNIKEILQEVAERYPDKYREVSHKLMTLSKDAMYFSGGYSFGLRHMTPSKAFLGFRQQAQKVIDSILTNEKLSDSDKSKQIIEYLNKERPAVQKAIFDEAMAENNPLALQIYSGTKGKPLNLQSIRGGDLLYEDHKQRTLPVPVLRGYAEGLSPVEYWAGTFGTRKGIVDLKMATSDAGYFAKQLTQAAHRLVVTETDHDEKLYDPTHPRGYPTDTNDPDNEGALLAYDAGPYKRNTILTPKILADLKSLGHEKILVRSPTVGSPPGGGVYANDVGVRERGGISPVGDFVGIGAAQAIAEPLAQAQIGCLVEGTLVQMADKSVKPIEAINIGDVVLGADVRTNTFPVIVTRIFNSGIRPCIRTIFKSETGVESELLSTSDHKLLTLTDSEVVEPSILPIGNEDVTKILAIKLDTNQLHCISKYTISNLGNLQTYDIEVGHEDHLFVLANGLIVSNSKHTGGVAGAGAGVSGFKAINQLVQVPKVFPGGATHSEHDGKVTKIEPAPGGGTNVFIDNKPHYVPIGSNPTVKLGDEIEAGDALSSGLVNPADVVSYKGIGDGRRAFVEAMKRAGNDAGFNLHRRNIELVARGLINHVKLNDEYGHYLPDEVVPYDTLEHEYVPRAGYAVSAPHEAVGKYLEKPVLHYSIGTKVRPSMIKQLSGFGVNKIVTHHEPPPFEPTMIRGMDSLLNDPDWMTRMLGSNLEKGLLKSVHQGAISDDASTSYVPSLARGENFGKTPPIKGFDIKELNKNREQYRSVLSGNPIPKL